MPRLSDSMEEGTILRWLASDGERIGRGQELAEIETDKASMVYESDAEGILHILAAEGDTLPIGAPIAQLLADGEEPSQRIAEPAAAAETAAAGNGAGSAMTHAGVGRSSGGGIDEGSSAASSEGDGVSAAPTGAAERVKASPVARRLAREAGLDLSGIAGSGPQGRIVKADVERAYEQRRPAAAAVERAGRAPHAKGQTETVELTRTQSLIARRMAEAKATIPEFTLHREIDMEAAVQLREQLKAIAERRRSDAGDLSGGTAGATVLPSFNDLVVRACALALREHPRANGSYRDGAFELHERVNIGVAVATEDALLVPILRDVDMRSIWEIAAEARRLAAAVRDGSITPPELSGGTFSVSNLGMYGVDSFTAVINPPQAAILAVGSLAQRPAARHGQIVARHTMPITLACDHRILYGADAARFLGTVAELLEQPAGLIA